MQIVVELDGRRTDLDLDPERPDATIGDVLLVLQAPTAAVDVDGRRVQADDRLDEVGLYDGSTLRVSTTSTALPDERDRGASVDGLAAVVVGGLAAGASVPLRRDRPVVVGRGADADLTVDDLTVSTHHAHLGVLEDGTVVVIDLQSRNGTYVDGEPASGPTPVPDHALVQIGGVQVQIVRRSSVDRPVAGGRHGAGSIPFNRPPRTPVAERRPPRPVPAAPDAEARRVPFSLALIIGPLVMGTVMVLVMGNLTYALFMLLSPIMAVGTWVSNKRRSTSDAKGSQRAHRQAIADLDRDLRSDAVAERRRREALLTDPAEVVRRAEQPSVRLWERRPSHPDFLRLRGGIGTVPWQPLDLASGADRPDLRDLLERHGSLRQVPVEIDLSAGGVVGIVGDRQAAAALARSLLCQAVTHHGPADLAVAVCAAPELAGDWRWTKWLPHVRDASSTRRFVAADQITAESLLSGLVAAAPDRLPGREVPSGPTRLLVVDDPSLLAGRSAPARTLLGGSAGRAAGIVLAPTEDRLPALCTTVVHADAAGELTVRRPAEGTVVERVLACGMTADRCASVARSLARYEDPELGLVGAGIPASVRLLPLLGDDVTDPAQIRTAWSRAGVDPGPSTPIGVGEDGTLVLDLKSDGPHALIGGTTGSGKSELLRSLVAGMAARVDPDHLVFVLIDYKGGSAFDECARLPHTVGMVTDLDDRLAERALRSMEAELRHRELVLRDAGTADLPEYLAAGSPGGPLPRLVVVIDEFATLAAELPDFLGALVGIAQRGRSLGVHLVLATQRPQGAVNASIRANTNLRIALRVQDPQDSTDIIDGPEAAAITRATPGRAYVRREAGRAEPVQTARSTGAVLREDGPPVRLAPFTFGPGPTGIGGNGAGEPGERDDPTELAKLVDAICTAFVASDLDAPRRPWLPDLPERVALDDLDAAADGVVPLGVVDDPDLQAQRTEGWRPAEGHLAVFGMVGSGTTTTLLTLGRSLAEQHHPDEVHLYGIDFGAGALAALGALPHTGTVVGATEREAQVRLIRHLRAELDRRRDLDAAARARLPLLLTLVDGVGGFLGEHEGIDGMETTDALQRLLAEGPTVGILFALAAERPSALPNRLGGAISQRLLLRLADPTDLTVAGIRNMDVSRFPAGRGFHPADRLLIQVAEPGDLVAAGASLRARWGSPNHPPLAIRTLPSRVTLTDLADAGGAVTVEPTVRIPIGIGDHALTTAHLELHAGEHAVVVGPARSGKSSTLATMASQLRDETDAIVVAVGPDRSPLRAVPGLAAEGTLEFLSDVLRAAVDDQRRWFVLVDDAGGISDRDGVLAALVASGRPGLHVIAAARPDDLRAGLTHWTRPVRSSRVGLLLQPDLTLDGDLLSVRLPRRLAVARHVGRGFLVSGGEFELVQTPSPSTSTDTRSDASLGTASQ